MFNTKQAVNSIRGSAQGKLLWGIVGIATFFAVKSMFFPSIKGQSDIELTSRFGEPVSKRVIPRPGWGPLSRGTGPVLHEWVFAQSKGSKYRIHAVLMDGGKAVFAKSFDAPGGLDQITLNGQLVSLPPCP